MYWIAQSLRAHPELALFLALGLGHAIGRLRVGALRLNAVIGVLLAGVAVGQIGIEAPPALQWSFFVLFLFSVGYKSGPQFFQGLGRGALPQAGLAVLFCATGLATTYALARLLGFTAGGAAGLIAGGLNASAAIGTAGDAIAKLPVPQISGMSWPPAPLWRSRSPTSPACSPPSLPCPRSVPG
jgi:putative transport protein